MPQDYDEAEILAAGKHGAEHEAMLAIRAIERQVAVNVDEFAMLSARQIEARTDVAFEEVSITPKDIAHRIEERSAIYRQIGLDSQVGAASYTVRREICHELGIVEVSDVRAFEILAEDAFAGKVTQRLRKFRHEFFYNDVKGCQENNWTGNDVLYFSRGRLFKGAQAIMTALGNLRAEIPVSVAKNIATVKPWNLFNSFCVMSECSNAGKGKGLSLQSGRTAVVLGVIEKVQKTGEGSYRAHDPSYFVLGVW